MKTSVCPSALLTESTRTSAVSVGGQFMLISNDIVFGVSEEHHVTKVLAASTIDREGRGDTVR